MVKDIRIVNKSNVTDIYLYDSIGADLFFGGIDAKQLVPLIADAKGRLNVRINSEGGDVFDGFTIYNALLRHPDAHTYVDGLAASIASVIALGGKTVSMAPNAFLMIHDPWMVASGTSDDFRTLAARMDDVGGQLAQIYANKSTLPLDQIEQWMAEETWFTSDAAITAGLADALDADTLPIAACLRGPMKYKHAPAQLTGAKPNYHARTAAMYRQTSKLNIITKSGDSTYAFRRRDTRPNGRSDRTESGHHGAGREPKPGFDRGRGPNIRH